MENLKNIADFVTELTMKFDILASNNPDMANAYIMENDTYLESLGILEDFESKVEWYQNAWHHEDELKAQAAAFHDRMDYF